jgi:hypothetical protein
MANTITKEMKITQTEKNLSHDEFLIESSIAAFFNKLTEKIEQLGNSSTKVGNLIPDKKFDFYSQAYQGFAQNNISKPEGFSLNVKVDPNYNSFLEEMVEKEKQKKSQATSS